LALRSPGKNPCSSSTETAGLVTTILLTTPSLNSLIAICTASIVLPVPAGPIAKTIYFLGFLSDEIVSTLLSQCRVCLLFFEKGARENNSTLVSAINHNCQVVTNFDEYTPKWIQDLPNVYDSKSVSIIPTKTIEPKSKERFTWNEFINEFEEQLFQ
jgi:hypothetical protein